jgi:hypothetical protein
MVEWDFLWKKSDEMNRGKVSLYIKKQFLKWHMGE